ncbi:MAG: glycosyltransferase family 2 protein [Methanosarcinales archaeon]|nr:glycosyltransferase family 2 protein [Methanosarcinales archaeon]
MSEFKLTTSVLFVVFNRPETTIQVFETIRQAKPPRLYVAADGAREDKEGELEKVKQVREIVNQVDWDCEVKTLFRDKNLGCKIAISSAIDWFFEHEEMGIILEDDCLPHPTFFRFCEELLEKYRDDERIAMISGNNFQFGRKRTNYSYYFSRYPHIWGWASWRRAWKNYDVDMKIWSEIRNGNWLQDLFKDKKSVQYWANIFEKTYQGKINSWGYRWTFSCWIQNALTVIPNVNLVSNIGFGLDASHTKATTKLSNISTSPIEFPLKHPNFIIRDTLADDFTQRNIFELSIITRVKMKATEFLYKIKD